ATFIGAVIGHRTALTISNRADTVTGNTVHLDQFRFNGVNPALRQILVVGIGTDGVRMAFKYQVDIVMLLHRLGDSLKLVTVNGTNFGLIELKQHLQLYGDSTGCWWWRWLWLGFGDNRGRLCRRRAEVV